MTTIVSEIVTTNEQLPAVQCAPWCQDGDGHTAELSPDDQWCHSTAQHVTLTRHHLVDGYSEGARMRDYVQSYLGREAEGRPYIHLGHGDEVGVELTPSEALELARVLTLLAGAAKSA